MKQELPGEIRIKVDPPSLKLGGRLERDRLTSLGTFAPSVRACTARRMSSSDGTKGCAAEVVDTGLACSAYNNESVRISVV